jgi:hypothetical protein
MANIKIGLIYYNIDTDRYQDIRIRRLKNAFGCSGIAVYDYILCEIYRVKGCFLVWNESCVFDVAEYFGLKENLVTEIVNYCGVVGLFDKALLTGGSVAKSAQAVNRCGMAGDGSSVPACGGIITSKSIQSRYIDMCTRAKRKDFKIPEECRIIPEESAKIPEESPKTAEVCDKEEESKEEENKEKPANAGKKKAGDAETPPKEKTWRDSFEIYLQELRKAYTACTGDRKWLDERQRYHPRLDIPLTLEKACKDYWAKEAGWKKKKAARTAAIDWIRTFNNALTVDCNKVWKTREQIENETNGQKKIIYV